MSARVQNHALSVTSQIPTKSRKANCDLEKIPITTRQSWRTLEPVKPLREIRNLRIIELPDAVRAKRVGGNRQPIFRQK
jgi:hypothetical protein